MSTQSVPVLAFDPGKDKCGLAIVSQEGEVMKVLERRIVPSREIENVLPSLLQEFGVRQIILGDSTTSRDWQTQLSTLLPDITIEVVPEAGSTLEARGLYWRANPPRGWRKVLPLSLQMPPEPVDDFAALVLAHRYYDQVES